MNDNDQPTPLATHARYNGWEYTHPLAVKAFRSLQSDLEAMHTVGDIPFRFRPFETYRTPARQQLMLNVGTSRARMYQSAHQVGLAVDFVPWTDEKRWTWEVDIKWWSILRGRALMHGLECPISWDKAHVEHPLWNRVRVAMWG